jgi:hypothetical protein
LAYVSHVSYDSRLGARGQSMGLDGAKRLQI